MKKPSDTPETWSTQWKNIIGLGEQSLRKTYYPYLQQKLDELERFRALLDQSNDCIFLFEASSLTSVDTNDSGCRQLNCSREMFLDLPLQNFLSEDTVERIRELVASGHAQGRNQVTLTTHLRRCSGEYLPVEVTFKLVTFNKILYGLAVARDITERILAEKMLLENSRLLRDMELAQQIQGSFLPTNPPELPGIRVAGCCVPAAHVGGDYFDYLRRGENIMDMVIADVSGHCLGAALMMAEARSILRAQVHSFSGTGDILASLNHILYDDLNRAELFITIFYVKYDTFTSTLTYSNAGHVPPLLFRPSEGGCRELDAEGLILGISRDVIFEEKQCTLLEGDVLLLYTDGITESRNCEGELFGVRRLSSILQVMHSEPPQAIIDAVLREVSEFSGTSAFEDDVTMIVLKID